MREFTIYEIQQLNVLELYDSKLILGTTRISRIDLLCAMFPCDPNRSKILESLQMTEKEELFAKFFSQAYNKGKDISQMDFPQLDTWIRELEEIVFEAKATLQGASQAKREREANLKSDERAKVRNADGTYSSTDAINVVNKRKDRMSKRDKLEDTYRALGIGEDEIKELLGKIKIEETHQTKPEITGPLSGLTFNGSPKPIDTCKDCNNDYEAGTKHECPKKPKTLVDKIVDSVLKAGENKPESKPFDPSGLFG